MQTRYLDDALPPEHVQQAAQLRTALNRLAALEKRVEDLESLAARQKSKIAFLEGAHRV